MREWICGRNPVYEVLRSGKRQVYRLLAAEGIQEKGRPEEILALAAQKKIPVERVSRQKIDALGESPQGVALETGGYAYTNLSDILDLARAREEPPFVLVLDLIQNPQNLGTLIRTAEAVGCHGVILPLRQAATITPAVVSASSGATELMLIAQANLAQSIDTLKETGVWVVGLEDSPEAKPPEQIRLDGPLALVVGNEGEGMRTLVRRSCDLLMRLPMRGRIDSLNAAVAGSIALFLGAEARRRIQVE